jgi:hypothetical protein
MTGKQFSAEYVVQAMAEARADERKLIRHALLDCTHPGCGQIHRARNQMAPPNRNFKPTWSTDHTYRPAVNESKSFDHIDTLFSKLPPLPKPANTSTNTSTDTEVA